MLKKRCHQQRECFLKARSVTQEEEGIDKMGSESFLSRPKSKVNSANANTILTFSTSVLSYPLCCGQGGIEGIRWLVCAFLLVSSAFSTRLLRLLSIHHMHLVKHPY